MIELATMSLNFVEDLLGVVKDQAVRSQLMDLRDGLWGMAGQLLDDCTIEDDHQQTLAATFLTEAIYKIIDFSR